MLTHADVCCRTLTLRKHDPLDAEGRFEMARVGLGSLGIVAEVTRQCVPVGADLVYY